MLTAGEADGTAWLWDRRTEKQVEPLYGHQGIIFSATLGADGDVALTASHDKTARVWDVRTPGMIRETARLEGHQGALYAADLRPDGRRVLTASADDTARLWRAEGGPALAVLEGHSKDVTGVAFDRTGTRAVTSSEDGTVRVWRLDSDRAAQVAELRGHAGTVRSTAFSPDGHHVIANDDGTARIWELNAAGQRYGRRPSCGATKGRSTAPPTARTGA